MNDKDWENNINLKWGQREQKIGIKSKFGWGKMKSCGLKLINILTQWEWRLFFAFMSGIIITYDISNENRKPYDNSMTSFRGS